jgi:protein phosphatase
MGGAAAGEVASQLACDTFLDCIVQRCCPPPDDPAPSAVPAHAPHSVHPRPRTRLADAVRAANHAVYRHSRKSPSLHGMGTTLVALLWENSVLRRQDDPSTPPIWLAHVGDSRCYRLRAGVLEQLTEDHSLVEEQVRAGVLSHLQANTSPMRNIITRAIGSHATVEAAIATHPTQPGDLYLLASDGLSCELDDSEIAAILTRTASPAALDAARAASDLALQTSLDAACHALIDAANAHGGRDNITVLLVPCP